MLTLIIYYFSLQYHLYLCLMSLFRHHIFLEVTRLAWFSLSNKPKDILKKAYLHSAGFFGMMILSGQRLSSNPFNIEIRTEYGQIRIS